MSKIPASGLITRNEMQPALDLSLEVREKLWDDWAKKCESNMEMIAANSTRKKDPINPENIAAFEQSKETFVQPVLEIIKRYTTGARKSLELGVGGGLFFFPMIEHMENHQGMHYGLDISPTVVGWLKQQLVKRNRGDLISRIWRGAAHDILLLPDKNIKDGVTRFQRGSLNAVLAIREDVHLPQEEIEIQCKEVQEALSDDGVFIIAELFMDERIKMIDRPTNPGTTYRYIKDYAQLLPAMELVFVSPDTFDNDGDPCQAIVFKKRPPVPLVEKEPGGE